MYEPNDPDDPDDPYVADEEADGNVAHIILEMHPLDPRYRYLEERRRLKCLLTLRRRRLRDASDPFDVTYEAFVKSYRLTQDLTFSLIDLIRPFLRNSASALAVPIELKVF